jgi:hypothetical protein
LDKPGLQPEGRTHMCEGVVGRFDRGSQYLEALRGDQFLCFFAVLHCDEDSHLEQRTEEKHQAAIVIGLDNRIDAIQLKKVFEV